MEANNKAGYTFNNEYDYVQSRMDYSQSCRFGGINNIGKMTISGFFVPTHSVQKQSSEPVAPSRALEGEGVSVFDVPLEYARHRYQEEPTVENRKKVEKEISIRKAIDRMGDSIINAAKPGVPSVSLTVCKNCDNSCSCYQYCRKSESEAYCKAECCNEEAACHQPPPSSSVNAETVDKCETTLSKAYYEACGNGHDYLRKVDGLLYRLCHRSGVNVDAAVQEINKQCSIYLNTIF